MSNKPLRWVRIADAVAAIGFNANGIAELDADGKRICVAKFREQLFAFAHKCPHASGFFVDGGIDGLGNIVCPLHRYRFSLQNGRNVSGEGYYLKHWPVALRDDGVYVGFEANALFGLF